MEDIGEVLDIGGADSIHIRVKDGVERRVGGVTEDGNVRRRGIESEKCGSGLAVTRERFRRPGFTPSNVVAKQSGDFWRAFENDFCLRE